MATSGFSHVQIRIEYEYGEDHFIDVPLQVFGYSTYAESAFQNGINTEGWFTVEDTMGDFHAVRLSSIRKITCELVKES